MSSSQQSTKEIIKFKSTNTSHQIIELQFDQNKTVLEYKQLIGELLDFDSFNIKFVFKGKVLNDKEKVGPLGLKASTVMMVLNKPKKVEKPTLSSSQQAIPRTNLSTGLGSSSPVGFGGYGIMNHPQYMSAISSAVDQQKLQQMMDDPFYQSMIEQMLEDPQTLKQVMEQNPMTKQMIEQNPMMKMIMSNPAMMKMVFNKDTIKMAKEMQKNGTITPQSIQNFSSQNSGLGGLGLGGFPGLGGLGGLSPFGTPGTSTNPVNPNTNNPSTTTNLLGNGMMSNPLFPMGMMGSGFGSNQGINFPNTQLNPFMLSNPFLMGSNLSTQNNQPPSTTAQSNPSNNNLMSLFQNIQNLQQKAQDEVKYSSQLKQLSSMGFNNRQKCVKFLKQSEGDIDRALEKLCLDDDEKSSGKQEKKE